MTAEIPEGRAADRRWKAIARRDRTALLVGRRRPERTEAPAALGYARRLLERSWLFATMNGLAAVAVWSALALLTGDAQENPVQFLFAVACGLAVFTASLVIGRRRARRLERHARTALGGRDAGG